MVSLKLPSQPVIQQCVREMEQQEHTAGWEQPSTIWAWFEPGPGLLGAAKMPLGNGENDFVPRLTSLAWAMLHDPEGKAMAKASTRDNVMGFLIVHEVMTNFMLTPLQQHLEDRDLMDVPGSQRVRIALGVDLLGRLYQVIRVQGFLPLETDVNMMTLGGQIPQALHWMCLAVAQQMPDGLDFVEALAKVEFPSHTETVQELARIDGDPNFIYIQQKAKH